MLLLVADIGNTNVHLGLYRGKDLVATVRFAVEKAGEIDAYWQALREAREAAASTSSEDVTGAVVCSVNPRIKAALAHWMAKLLGRRPLVVGENLKLDLPVRVDSPEEVGADRVVNAFAAWKTDGRGPILIADFGTAITFDVVSEKGEFLGGAIAPGFRPAARALSDHTALLPVVRVEKAVERAIGKNTVDAIQSGLYFGLVGLCDAVCERIVAEIGTEPSFVATGGDAELVASKSRYFWDLRPNLTMDGLRLAFEAAPAAGAQASEAEE